METSSITPPTVESSVALIKLRRRRMALSAIAGISAAAAVIIGWVLWVQYRESLVRVPTDRSALVEIPPPVDSTAPVDGLAGIARMESAGNLAAKADSGADASAQRSAAIALPARDRIQEEISDNPHQTPVSLLQYAENIALKIEEATNDPEKAKALFTELETCVNDNSSRSAPSLQALCLANADELALTHPELQGRYQEMLKGAPADARKLLEAADQVGDQHGGAPPAGLPFDGE